MEGGRGDLDVTQGESFGHYWVVGVSYLSIHKHKHPHKDERD